MHALPPLWFSAEALMRLVGCKAQQVRQGVWQRGAATRQGPRPAGPIGPATRAEHIGHLNVRALEARCKGVIRALAQGGVCAAKGTGLVDATDLETTAPDAGCGQVTRPRKVTDQRGQVHEIEGTGSGVKLLVFIEARTKIPLAAPVVPSQEHAGLSTRALVTHARTTLAGDARLHQVVCDRGLLEGVDRWWLDPPGLLCVGPATDQMAVTLEAQAQAAAGEGVTMGRRAHTVRPGQGRASRTERLETAVVGIAGLTTDDQSGTPEHGRPHHRRDFPPTRIHAVVVRKGTGHASGPAGPTVFLTNAAVDQPLPPFDADADRHLIEPGWMNERQQPWRLQPPPQKTARAVRVHGILTVLMCALATAYRWPCAPEDSGGAPVGWQRWRRQLQEQTRDLVIVLAQDAYGIVHLAEYSRLLGVNLNDRPPGIGTRPHILAQ
jgi:hypothetical protein